WEDSVLTLKADATGIAARWLGRFINLDALYDAPADAGSAVTGTAVAGSASATPVPATPTHAASQDLPLELTPGRPRGLPRDLLLAAAIDFTGDLSDASAGGWRGTVQIRREAGDVALAGRNGSDPVRAGLEVLEA